MGEIGVSVTIFPMQFYWSVLFRQSYFDLVLFNRTPNESCLDRVFYFGT